MKTAKIFLATTALALSSEGGCATSLPPRHLTWLPEIRIVERNAIKPDAPIVYDKHVQGYIPVQRIRQIAAPSSPAFPELPVVPAGLSFEESKARAVDILRLCLRFEPEELRIRRVSRILRGTHPQYEGWEIRYEQSFLGTTLYNGENDTWERVYTKIPGGVNVTVYGGDDWILRAHLFEVTPLLETGNGLITEREAKRIASEALHIRTDKPHEFVRWELGYVPFRETESFHRVPGWLAEVRVDVEPSQVSSYMLAHKGGIATIDARTGKILGGDPLEPNWPTDPSYWDQLQIAAADWGEVGPVVRAALNRIKMGMLEAEADQCLSQAAKSSTLVHLGGSGAYNKVYELEGNQRITVHFSGSYDPKMFLKVVHVDVEPRLKLFPKPR